GETAENLVDKYGITRAEQDQLALEPHQRAVAAQGAGRFADEIVPISVAGNKKGEKITVAADQGPRAGSSLDKLGRLEPGFRAGAAVPAGTSSTLNDGAAALLVTTPERAHRMGWKPLARVVTGAAVGVDPRTMGIGPVPATKKALARAGWQLTDLDLVELNE